MRPRHVLAVTAALTAAGCCALVVAALVRGIG